MEYADFTSERSFTKTGGVRPHKLCRENQFQSFNESVIAAFGLDGVLRELLDEPFISQPDKSAER
jgi:hypothetical protein